MQFLQDFNEINSFFCNYLLIFAVFYRYFIWEKIDYFQII